MNDISQVLTEKQKMLTEQLYFPSDKTLQRDRARAKLACYQYNQTSPEQRKSAFKQLNQLFSSNNTAWIEANFYCDYGYNIQFGKQVFLNHGVTILDAARVHIGDHVMFGPNVVVSTATHPMDPEQRQKGLETAHPILIGNNVWIGMGAQILPGVTIGDNSVVGAGAVVTRSVPANTVVGGVPAKVIKVIGE